jgi:DUF1680 family protein
VTAHEDFCAGHLIEAAVAYYHATGERKLLDVAIRFADHIDSTFRVPNRPWLSGHEEIELASMKLFRLTGEKRYMRLSEWYLAQRGRQHDQHAPWTRKDNRDYCQDQAPVKSQREMVGHAVRAMYLYAGAADVAITTHDTEYMHVLKAVWQDLTQRKMYITGGIGSAQHCEGCEGFENAFELPNAQAYCESCAACGMVFWNHRMAQMTGEAQYIDVLERSLYNGVLVGLSLGGDRFFYQNSLAATQALSRGGVQSGRQEWFQTACCPPNIARLVTSLGGYIYGASDSGVWVNLFASGIAHCRVRKTDMVVRTQTGYPWDGRVTITLDPGRPVSFPLRIRIPGWAKGIATPGGLYSILQPGPEPVRMRLNGRVASIREEKGYAVIERRWHKGDTIEIELPMDIQRIVARLEVRADREHLVLQRGPLVYCMEGADNPGNMWDLIVPRQTKLSTEAYRVLNESVVAIRGDALVYGAAPDGLDISRGVMTFTAIPYYAWANRESHDMQVWVPTSVGEVNVHIRD